MKFKRLPIENEEYGVALDDHCLVITSGISKKPLIWLSKKACEWIAKNIDLIDFDKQMIERKE